MNDKTIKQAAPPQGHPMGGYRHAPGPYRVTYNCRGRLSEVETVEQEFGKYRHLTNQLPFSGPGEKDAYGNEVEMVATAHLFAASPELFAACAAAIAHCNDPATYDPSHPVHKCIAAV